MATASSRGPGRPRSEAVRSRREEEILDAAIGLFAVHGYADTATQALADVLGVGKGTIYRYFPSKRELFLAAVDRIMRILKEGIEARVAAFSDPLERLERAVDEYLAFFAQHPGYVELLIQERAHFKDRLKPTYFEHRDAGEERFKEVFRSLMAQGRVREMPVERITNVLSDLMYGTMFTNFFTRRSLAPAEQARDILEMTMYGCLSDNERQRRGGQGPANLPPGKG